MAGVKSLAVRGIRSFGPDEGDEQRIGFEKPLTLILGQNGCGKTTIIECLRYAITGQMPPGSRNECFVHDAKVNRTTEVMGQVKLKIMNAKDKQLEVSRSMRVTALHNRKTKFQTLDSFLSVVDENGKTKDISSRCADLDFVMNEELGVSKAILNSVIFCHQEDSSWPLDEGKKVKERFDEIFDADKYSDCFDKLRKLRKEYVQTMKLLEQEVACLTEKKHDLDRKKLEVVNTESRMSEAEIKINELAEALKPISEKLVAIEKLQKELVQYETHKEKIKTKLAHNETQEGELKAAIKTIFEGTSEELEEKITNYASIAKEKQKELDNLNKQTVAYTKQEKEIANEKNSNNTKFNKLIFLESQNQERVDKLNALILETAKLAGIELKETDIETPEQVATAIENISQKIGTLREELKQERDKCDAEEKALQKVVDDTREEYSSHKEKIRGKQSEIDAVKKELIKAERAILDANKSKQQLEALEKKISTSEDEYQNVAKELNPEECQNEINEDEKMQEKYEQDLKELDAKVVVLQKMLTKIKEKDMIEDSLKEKEKKFAILKNKHRSAISDLLGQMPEGNFAVSINKFECEKRNEVDGMRKKLRERQMEVTTLEAERKHLRESLIERRGELSNAEDQMYKACGTQPYESTLAKLTSQVEKLQEDKNFLQSSMFIFAKYKSQLKDNSCCPLCNRGFDNDGDVSDLVEQLTNQVLNVPTKLEKVTEELQKSSAKKDDLLSKKSLNEKIIALKETDIPQLEKRLAEVDKKKSSASEAVEELTMALIEPEQKLQTAKQIQGDMPMLDRYTQEIKTTSAKLEVIKSECPTQDADMTLEEATTKQTDLRQKITSIRANIKKINSQLNAYNKKLQVLSDKKNKFKEQLLTLQKKVQDVVTVEENKKTLNEKIENLKKELEELNKGTEPLQQQLQNKEKEKNEAVKKLRDAINERNTSITNVQNTFNQVKAVDKEVKAHKERNIKLEMAQIKESNDKLTEKQKQITADKIALAKQIDDFKDELAKQDIYKRDLEDNRKMRKAQAEIENCKKELVEVDEKMSGVNTEMIAEKGDLISKQTQLFKEKAVTEGNLQEMQKMLAKLKAEVKNALAKDIEKKFREKYYELHVIKATDKDIRDYSVALEKCLMEFHREKMEHINLIIRELWRKIYRGNDIDYIEIKTESSMTSDNERRKYDYRVVQCKNGVEIDMRGRCSAGQKVLACLIIRLALAETFSSRFGILALDEPTTNLDHENIRSLCSALGEIVQERMTQKNFMFIIITHDKEFIDSLGSIDKVTHYYEVSRNEDGKSRIKKIRFT